MSKFVKRFLMFFLLIFTLFSTNVFAKEVDIKVIDAKVVSKSNTAEVETPTIDGNNINTNVTFNEQDDFVVYEVTIKNNDDEAWKINSVEDNYTKDNLKIDYEYDKDLIEKGKTSKVKVTITYKKKLVNTESINIDDLKISLNLINESGNANTIVITNPNTKDGILKYLVLLIVAVTGLIFIKTKKIYKGLKVGNLLILTLILMSPFMILAEEKYQMNINIKTFTLKSEYLDYEVSFNTDGAGSVDTRNVTYGQPIGELPELRKDGYTFNGWKDQDGNVVTENTVVKGKLDLEADFTAKEYNITYNLDKGTVTPSDVNPTKYTIEDEFDLVNPTRKGYTFAGWTEDGSEDLYTRVTISHETGTKAYTAHWSKNQNTKYYVNHKYPNLDGTYETVREELTGPTDTEVTAPFKPKTGFDNPTTSQNLTISADEDSEVTYTYTRHEYNLTLNDDIETTFTNPKYPYETEITLTAKDKANYEFTGWSNGKTTKTITFNIVEDTEVYPLYKATGFTVTYNANGGNFYDATKLKNEVTYILKDETVTKYSHTSNIDDEGTQNGNYENKQSINDVVTIPGATRLHVKLTYSTEENCDFISIAGTTHKFSGSSDEPTTVEFDLSGDTVIFNFSSDTRVDGYGYYAEVTGYVKYEPIEGTYEIPTKTDNVIKEWYTDDECSNGNEFDISTANLSDNIEVYAKWQGGIAKLVPMTNYIEFSLLNYGTSIKNKGIFINKQSKSFVRSNSLPEIYNNIDYLVSSTDSDIPIYMWYEEDTQTTKIYSDSTKIFMNEQSAGLFYECSKLESIDVSYFDTSLVENMMYMFYNCQKLQSLNVSNFNTKNVKNMAFMFTFFRSLEYLNVSSFNTTKVTNMNQMFSTCTKLEELNVNNFDTHNVTDMSAMFANLASLNILNVSGFDTSNVTDMSAMFERCANLEEIDVSNFDTSNVTDMSFMFDMSPYDSLNITDNKLKRIIFSNKFNTSKVTDMSNMFSYDKYVSTLDLSSFDTSNVTNMSKMFGFLGSTDLDLNNFNTSNVIDMSLMFIGCNKLLSLDLNSFDTSKVTSMRSMFQNCKNLKTIKVSDKFITTTVTNSSYMFTDSTLLVGGRGTVYDAEHIDKAYAHIDGGSSNPGYFTSNITSYTVTFNSNGGGDVDSITVDAGDVISSFETPTAPTNKVFAGWYTGIDNGVKVDTPYTPEGNITLYAHWNNDSFPVVFSEIGECSFNGASGVLAGDDCGYANGINKYIDTGINLYNTENHDKDYEIGFTIVSYNPSEQVKQATFVNTKLEGNSYPGLVFRRMDNETVFDLSSRRTSSANERKLFNYGDVEKVKIYRITNQNTRVQEIFYSINGEEKIKLNDLSKFNPTFDLSVWFGAAPTDISATSAQRILTNTTLSNMYIKVGTYHE